MDLHLKDKVVVITGGTTGIGKEIAKLFLEEGCAVAVCDYVQEKIDFFKNEFKNQAIFADFADVTSQESMNNFAKNVAEHFGGIDIWINNAGIYPKGTLLEMPNEQWLKTFDVNVHGLLYASRAAIPFLKKRNGGVILNAASYATIIPVIERGAYAASKSAILSITNVMAAELAPANIRVLSYIPGFILTDLTKEFLSANDDKALKSQVALNRHGTVEDIAPVVVFLASDAAKFITGCSVEISGGKFCVQNPGTMWN